MILSEIREITYNKSRIKACKYEDRKGRKGFLCDIYRPNSLWQPLHLGQCNDGSKFTSVNQAINQAKDYIDELSKKQESADIL